MAWSSTEIFTMSSSHVTCLCAKFTPRPRKTLHSKVLKWAPGGLPNMLVLHISHAAFWNCKLSSCTGGYSCEVHRVWSRYTWFFFLLKTTTCEFYLGFVYERSELTGDCRFELFGWLLLTTTRHTEIGSKWAGRPMCSADSWSPWPRSWPSSPTTRHHRTRRFCSSGRIRAPTWSTKTTTFSTLVRDRRSHRSSKWYSRRSSGRSSESSSRRSPGWSSLDNSLDYTLDYTLDDPQINHQAIASNLTPHTVLPDNRPR